jgi:ABC-type antimicrobial peptide transport system permease subunit
MIKKLSKVGLLTLTIGTLIVPSFASAAQSNEDTKKINNETKHEQSEYTVTSTSVDGVNIAIINSGKANQQLTKEAKDFIKQKLNSKKQNKKDDGTTYVEQHPGDGEWTTYSKKDGSFYQNNFDEIENWITAACSSVSAAAGFYFSKSASGAAAAAAVGTLAAEYIADSIEPDWTTTEWVKYYSSYYGEDVYRYVNYTYQTEYRNDDEIVQVALSTLFVLRNGALKEARYAN